MDVVLGLLVRGWDLATGGLLSLVKTGLARIWNSLGREKLVRALSGVSSVKINKSSTVRLKCPNPDCGQSSDFSIERLDGNPKCLLCQQTFDGAPFVKNLNDQLLAAVQRI